MTATKSFGARDDAIHHRDHTNATPYHHDVPAIQAIAIEVLPNIVNAELVENHPGTDTNTDLPSPCTTTPPPPIQLPWYRHRVAFWCFWCVNVLTFGAVAAGIGVYCGSGKTAHPTEQIQPIPARILLQCHHNQPFRFPIRRMVHPAVVLLSVGSESYHARDHARRRRFAVDDCP
jgi:hypothetical protein